MKFSLVLGTYNSGDEQLEKFIISLSSQSNKNYELVIVDQNNDERVKRIIDKYINEIGKVQQIKIKEKGLSKARNIGLNYVKGEILAFPDDDCEYPPELLTKVEGIFKRDTGLSILSGKCIDKNSYEESNVKWRKNSCAIKSSNMFKTANSISLFIKRSCFEYTKFDEFFGVGSIFGSAEETDLLYRLIYHNYKGIYDPSILVYHPAESIGLNRLYNYGLGLGAFFRKHISINDLPLFKECIRLMIIRPIGGILLSLMVFNMKNLLLYLSILKGRWFGFFKYNKYKRQKITF